MSSIIKRGLIIYHSIGNICHVRSCHVQKAAASKIIYEKSIFSLKFAKNVKNSPNRKFLTAVEHSTNYHSPIHTIGHAILRLVKSIPYLRQVKLFLKKLKTNSFKVESLNKNLGCMFKRAKRLTKLEFSTNISTNKDITYITKIKYLRQLEMMTFNIDDHIIYASEYGILNELTKHVQRGRNCGNRLKSLLFKLNASILLYDTLNFEEALFGLRFLINTTNKLNLHLPIRLNLQIVISKASDKQVNEIATIPKESSTLGALVLKTTYRNANVDFSSIIKSLKGKRTVKTLRIDLSSKRNGAIKALSESLVNFSSLKDFDILFSRSDLPLLNKFADDLEYLSHLQGLSISYLEFDNIDSSFLVNLSNTLLQLNKLKRLKINIQVLDTDEVSLPLNQGIITLFNSIGELTDVRDLYLRFGYCDNGINNI